MSTDANAPGARPSLGHIRGLDGVRAFAVLSIIAFHTGLNSLPGGFYGVDAFFVLSGFLITALLVKEWGGTGTIRLTRFWAGRARRLLPALFLMVTVVGVVMAVWPQLLATPNIVGDAVSTIFYYSNWYSLHTDVTYFNLSSQPSPFLHTWSLAIEEQFYLVWPLVVLGVLKLGAGRVGRPRSRAGAPAPAEAQGALLPAPAGAGDDGLSQSVPVLGGGTVVIGCRPATGAGPVVVRDAAWSRRRRLHVLFAVACLGSVASALVMAFLAPNGYTTRAYYGTDCRAQALLVGAAIAIGLTLWREGAEQPWFARLASGLGLAGAAGTAALWCTTSETSTFAFSGGFLVASLAAGGVVLGCVAAPRSPVVRFLELPPFPQWGRISYGVYLWYWPVLLVMTPERLHWGVYPLFLARVGVTVAIAALSYDLVEMPIRRGILRQARTWVALPVGAALAVGAVVVSTLVPVGATVLEGAQLKAPPPAAATVDTTETTLPGQTSSGAPSTTVPFPSYLSPAAPAPVEPAKRVKVLVVGDSVAGTLAVGLAQVARGENVQVVDEGLPGCSAATIGQIDVGVYQVPPGTPCDHRNPDALFDTWRRWVAAYNPDVVVYLARAETFNQLLGGRWQNIGQPRFDGYLTARLSMAAQVLGARGARVVFLTSPYYDGGAQPSGAPWPEDVPVRVHLDNATLRQVAATASGSSSDPGGVYVFDLNSLVSPGGRYASAVGSTNVRCADGVHFSASGGIYVGLRLVPDLVALGQSHAAASPVGAWPGPLPPSTPPWYAKLPC